MEKKSGSKAKKVFNVILNIIIWVFVAFAVVVTILAFAAQANDDGVPAVGNTCILTVQSNSMEPTFDVGDIILGTKLAPEDKDKLEVGDVITFKIDLDGNGTDEINSHRITEVITSEVGGVSYKTKGDNEMASEDESEIYPDKIIAKWGKVTGECKFEDGKFTSLSHENGKKIKSLGKVLDYLQQPKGFLVCIVLPLVLFFFYELFLFIKKFLEIRNSNKKSISAEDEELIKKRAIEEYLKSQQGAVGSEPEKEEPKSDADPEPESEENTKEEASESTEEQTSNE